MAAQPPPEEDAEPWEPPSAFSEGESSSRGLEGSGEGSSSEDSSDGSSSSSSAGLDMSTLARRISSVQESEELRARLEGLEQAYVLVFDEDTEDETVYSMEVEQEGDAPVVLAFECEVEAAQYARSITLTEEEFDESVASVQALDVEALVVTSRDADIRVAIVFRGDLLSEAEPSLPTLITGVGAPPSVSLTITMVPDDIFEDKTSADFLDPSEDPVWVLIHDEGTADAQFFSMTLNGTASVVCFKDEASAQRCGLALENRGAAGSKVPSARSLLLEEILDSIGEEDLEVCLVDEVVETIIEDESQAGVVAADSSDIVVGQVGGADGSAGSESSASTANVRAMLNRCLSNEEDESEGI